MYCTDFVILNMNHYIQISSFLVQPPMLHFFITVMQQGYTVHLSIW